MVQMNGPSTGAAVATASTEPKRAATHDEIAATHTAGARSHPNIHVPDASRLVPVQHAPAALGGADAAAKTTAAANAAQQSLQQFDEALQNLANRPEAQILRARFGLAANNDKEPAVGAKPPSPTDELNNSGRVDGDALEKAADTNKDGKVSEEELLRYQMPLTYRSIQRAFASLTDAPSAFSLAEAHRAYGQVAAQALAA